MQQWHVTRIPAGPPLHTTLQQVPALHPSHMPAPCSPLIRVNIMCRMPDSTIIPDRSFNSTALTNVVMNFPTVSAVRYVPRDAPDMESVEFSRVWPGGRQLAPK